MSKRILRRGGSAADHAAFEGGDREITVDTDTYQLRVHDGVTPGGHLTAKQSDMTQAQSDIQALQADAVTLAQLHALASSF